jgi:formate hydrogenlyase transcriptional activator
MHVGSVIQFMTLMDTNAPMDRIEINYRALLAVAVVLNSQREMQSLWEAITGEITKVVPWARATVTLYDQEADGFKFYVIATTVANVVLQRDAVIPRIGSGMITKLSTFVQI